MDNQKGPTVQHMNSAQVMCQPGCGGVGADGGWTRVCMAESLPCSPETITALLIGYIAIQNKDFKKFGGKKKVSSSGHELLTFLLTFQSHFELDLLQQNHQTMFKTL